MYHPNIYADGGICLDILQKAWSPIYDVAAVLTSVQSLLSDPNPDSPANAEAARLYGEDRREYNRRVKEVVERSWIEGGGEEGEEAGEEGGGGEGGAAAATTTTAATTATAAAKTLPLLLLLLLGPLLEKKKACKKRKKPPKNETISSKQKRVGGNSFFKNPPLHSCRKSAASVFEKPRLFRPTSATRSLTSLASPRSPKA